MLGRRTFLCGTAAAASLPLLDATPASAAPTVGAVLAKGMQVPWGVAFLPDGDAIVTERPTGRVYRVFRRGGRRLIGRLQVANDGEGGLLGCAVPPSFARTRWVYFHLTRTSGSLVVRRKYVGGSLGPPHVVLDGIPYAPYHDGGRLAFGPDGMLYVSTGDAGRSDNAQDKASLSGKILRIRPDGSVPPGNPFGNKVWSYGHRNVEGLAWDRRGRMWATEFGESTRDELNRIRPGRNYGWPNVEGGDGPGPYADPFVTWPTPECSPSGVAIAGGRAWVGALCGESLWAVWITGPKAGRKARYFHGRFGRIRTVQRAPDGTLWITTSNRDGRGEPGPTDDRVIRIRI